MEIIQKEKNGIVCVTVKGRKEAGLTREFKEVVKQIVEGDKRRLLIDLGALQYLRSSVLNQKIAVNLNVFDRGLNQVSLPL